MSFTVEYVSPAKRGVAYLSSIPRDMRPQEVCSHFNRFGTILRHRFVPFPKKARRPGGPLLPLQYREGWIEFRTAAEAKAAAAYMNAQPVECKRTRRCYGQLWNVKYLAECSWDTLVEEREGERRARRMAEVDARRQERTANEAYRAIAMRAQQQRRRSNAGREMAQLAEEEEEKPNAAVAERPSRREEAGEKKKKKSTAAEGLPPTAMTTTTKKKKKAAAKRDPSPRIRDATASKLTKAKRRLVVAEEAA